MSAPLLVELFTEELPPKALQRLGEAFASVLRDELRGSGLLAGDCALETFATPRRLAVRLSSVLARGTDRQTDEKLLPEKVGLDANGKPTAALLKKLAALGRDESAVALIKKASDGKLAMLFLPTLAAGQTLQAGLQAALEKSIERLPIPKVMSYQLPGSTETVKFVRPAHGLVALHDNDIVNVTALGLTAGRVTHGHRFLGTRDIELKSAGEYEGRLKDEGKVIAGFEVRRAEIDQQLKGKATELGCSLGDYEMLLDEVTALVEWPVVYVAGFEPEFLSVPQECLILTMRTNQKYFPLFEKSGKLTEQFLVVSNMQVADPKNIIEGNQRVVRPRLADARFFYEQDRKVRLETRVPALGKVVYHNKLGSQLERVERIQLLAGKIARLTGADPLLAERAAWLAKADLLTGMIGEFPELQGIMGRYYAQHDSEPAVVADAIAEHYLPRFAGDKLPESDVACCVALADKLDTMAGLFGIGQTPTGEKDPFGLRRAALGVLRILIEREEIKKPPALGALIDAVFAGHNKAPAASRSELKTFIYDRLAGYLKERGYSTLEIEAVLSKQLDHVWLVIKQLDAVRAFLALPEAESLAAANKRIRNILAKATEESTQAIADPKRMTESAEKQLYDDVIRIKQKVGPLFDARQYKESLCALSTLRPSVDRFFDEVMVNVDDAAIRLNRLRLLHELDQLMNKVADISKLAA